MLPVSFFFFFPFNVVTRKLKAAFVARREEAQAATWQPPDVCEPAF